MSKFKEKLMPEDMLATFKGLNKMEQKYFSIMWAKYGVLNITSKPGVAKSAIGRAIADKMGFAYKDIRLTMVDETDVGLYPNVSEVNVDGVMIKCLDFVVPRWAIEANTKPTILHFEELNRATQQVRNAALQILLERQIGTDFKFNSNVLMMSSGNLGDEDNTDVEEFDSALNNRLIHVDHTLEVREWLANFAEDNVHSSIKRYIEIHPDQIYSFKDGDRAYATPRSWTMLSEYIISMFGFDSDIKDFLPTIREIAASYVGNSAIRFLRYCDESVQLSIDDIINDFKRVKPDLAKFNRDKKSELLFALKERDINDLDNFQIDNIISFLNEISDEEKTGYLLELLDSPTINIETNKYERLFAGFIDLLKNIRVLNESDKKHN